VREAVDGGHDRCRHKGAVGQRQEIEAVVDEVELPGPFEDRRDVQALQHLGIAGLALLRPAPGVTDARRAAVAESLVAKSVTSTPRATSLRSAARRTVPTARSDEGGPATRSVPARRRVRGAGETPSVTGSRPGPGEDGRANGVGQPVVPPGAAGVPHPQRSVPEPDDAGSRHGPGIGVVVAGRHAMPRRSHSTPSAEVARATLDCCPFSLA